MLSPSPSSPTLPQPQLSSSHSATQTSLEHQQTPSTSAPSPPAYQTPPIDSPTHDPLQTVPTCPTFDQWCLHHVAWPQKIQHFANCKRIGDLLHNTGTTPRNTTYAEFKMHLSCQIPPTTQLITLQEIHPAKPTIAPELHNKALPPIIQLRLTSTLGHRHLHFCIHQVLDDPPPICPTNSSLHYNYSAVPVLHVTYNNRNPPALTTYWPQTQLLCKKHLTAPQRSTETTLSMNHHSVSLWFCADEV